MPRAAGWWPKLYGHVTRLVRGVYKYEYQWWKKNNVQSSLKISSWFYYRMSNRALKYSDSIWRSMALWCQKSLERDVINTACCYASCYERHYFQPNINSQVKDLSYLKYNMRFCIRWLPDLCGKVKDLWNINCITLFWKYKRGKKISGSYIRRPTRCNYIGLFIYS